MVTLGQKSVQEVSSVKTYSKTDSRYWGNVIYRPTYRSGEGVQESKDWAVKIQHAKRRESFPLGTANKQQAATKARDIFMSLKHQGWKETLAVFKPDAQTEGGGLDVSQTILTVGEYLEAAGTVLSTDPYTFTEYCRCFRRIVASVAKIKSDESKHDYVHGGRDRWAQQIHAVALSDVTAARIMIWKSEFLKKRSADPRELRKAKNSVNSCLRKAKSLFSKKVVPHLPLEPGFVSPFEGVVFEKRQSMRYRGQNLDIGDLLRLARAGDEGQGVEPLSREAWKICLLAIGVGLRRKEIDLLEWGSFDFEKAAIEIRETQYFKPKSEDSLGIVEVDEEIVALFKGYRTEATGSFVIESHREPKPNSTYVSYRCDHHFKELITWLRARGVVSRTPIQTLRKEFGSMMCQKHGIFIASRSLRHADVAITAEHYLEKKERAVVGIGGQLGLSRGNGGS